MEVPVWIVSAVADYAVQPVVRQVGYLTHYKRNCQNLQAKVEKLTNARERLLYGVEAAKRKGDNIVPDILNWLCEVDRITQEANKFLNDEHQAEMKCLSPTLRYKLSRKSTKMGQVVDELYEKRDFDNISFRGLPEEAYNISTQDYEAFDSRIATVKKIIDELRNPNTNVIGVYGIGGVGKTTLAKEICRQVTKEKLFDAVVMVLNVRHYPDLEIIQSQIAETLGLEIYENETVDDRAHRIYQRIKERKILVTFDDVGEGFNFEPLGIPNVATCKILLISRCRTSLNFFTHKEFQLHVLEEEETWRLFEKTVGDVVRDPMIRTVAIEVAKKCGGFPILVVTVASLLRNRSTSHSWENALTQLESFVRNRLTERAYLALEWSYEQLDGEELKLLFLLCGITAWRNYISLEDLLIYSMSLGLFKNISCTEEARYALCDLVQKLKDSCLLLDCGYNLVRIHDFIRDFAISVAFRDLHILSRAYGAELDEWPNQDFLKKCTMISLPCCNIPRLPEALECPKVELFSLGGNDNSLQLPHNFFKEMKELKVLDLTDLFIPSLPTSLLFLANIQTLCLYRCVLEDIALVGQLTNLEILSFANSLVKCLPEEIGQLSRLRLLDLNNCSELEVIFPDVLSSLERLEDLRMKNSFNQWEAAGAIGERSNASILELKQLSQLIRLEIHIRDADILPAGLFSNKLERHQILIGDQWEWDTVDESLNLLKLKLTTSSQLDQGLEMLLKRSETLYLDTPEGLNNIVLDSVDFQQPKHLHVQNNAEKTFIINEKVMFPNLTSLVICRCDGLRFLLSSSTARGLVQLKHLEICECQMMEEIVLTKENDDENTVNMFQNLQHLKLKGLPNLAGFYSGSNYMEFASLERLQLKQCSKLETFIFDPSTRNVPIHNPETVVQYFLFDEKVGFPRLERLSINGITKFTQIWSNKLAPASFCRLKDIKVQQCTGMTNMFLSSMIGRLNALKTLYIWYCESLRVVFEHREIVKESHDTIAATPSGNFYCQDLESVYIGFCGSLKDIFPTSMARSDLRLLRELKVEACYGVEEIVAEAEAEELETSMLKFVFPKMTSMTFRELPQLRSFYPGLHTSEWPLLKTLDVYICDQVEIFSAEISSFQKAHELVGPFTSIKQPFFLIEKGSFPNLENLTLGAMDVWFGPPGPAQFFRKLTSVVFRCAPCDFKQPAFLQIGSGNSDGTFPHPRKLVLLFMEKLLHLWKEEPKPAAPVFPNLEILEVKYCGLKNLESSAISFQNLTTLEVNFCWRLKYLMTCSIAKNLVQLMRLKVEYCESLTEIVASNGDGGDARNYEIVLSRLQRLELCYLRSLQGFCSGNCTARCPALKTSLVTDCPFKLEISPAGVLVFSQQE